MLAKEDMAMRHHKKSHPRVRVAFWLAFLFPALL